MHCITNADIQQMAENEEGWNGTCHSQLLREDSRCSLSRSSPTHSCLTAVHDCLPGLGKCWLVGWLCCLPFAARSSVRGARPWRRQLRSSSSSVTSSILGLERWHWQQRRRRRRRGEGRGPRCGAVQTVVEHSRRVTSFVTRGGGRLLSLLPSVAASATRATPPASRHLE